MVRTYPAADGKHSLDVCSPLKETYPAAIAAPLSRGDNGWRITMHTTIDSNTCKVALPRVPFSKGYGEAGGYEKDADRIYPAPEEEITKTVVVSQKKSIFANETDRRQEILTNVKQLKFSN